MEVEEKYGGGGRMEKCMERKGRLVRDEWWELLKKKKWVVGVWMEGGEELDDE